MAQPIEFFEELKQRLSEVQSPGKYPIRCSSAQTPEKLLPQRISFSSHLDSQLVFLMWEWGRVCSAVANSVQFPVTNHLLYFRFCLDASVREAAEVDVRRMRDENVVSIRGLSAEHLLLGAKFHSLLSASDQLAFNQHHAR